MSVGIDRYKYGTFSVAGTVTLSSGTPGILHCLNIMDTTIGTVSVVNGTSSVAGTIALILAGTQNSYYMDAEFGSAGLSIVTTGNTKGNVTYTLI